MSNKETLQNHNTRLNDNNIDLDSILNTINTLPNEVEIKLQEKSVTPSTEKQEIVADEGYTGLSKVTVEAMKSANVKITDASYLFYYNARLNQMNEILSLCENVTKMNNMFQSSSNLTSIHLSNFDTSKVTNISNMFYGCSNLTSIDLSNLNFSNCNNMNAVFQNCTKLTSLNLTNINISNATNFQNTFYYCRALTELDLSSMDMSNAIDISAILSQCTNLTTLKSFKNLGKGYTSSSTNYSNYTFNLSTCTKLTHDSLIDVINNLYDLNLTYDVANGGTLYKQKIELGITNLRKLQATEEGLQALVNADAKGWNVT